MFEILSREELRARKMQGLKAYMRASGHLFAQEDSWTGVALKWVIDRLVSISISFKRQDRHIGRLATQVKELSDKLEAVERKTGTDFGPIKAPYANQNIIARVSALEDKARASAPRVGQNIGTFELQEAVKNLTAQQKENSKNTFELRESVRSLTAQQKGNHDWLTRLDNSKVGQTPFQLTEAYKNDHAAIADALRRVNTRFDSLHIEHNRRLLQLEKAQLSDVTVPEYKAAIENLIHALTTRTSKKLRTEIIEAARELL